MKLQEGNEKVIWGNSVLSAKLPRTEGNRVESSWGLWETVEQGLANFCKGPDPGCFSLYGS